MQLQAGKQNESESGEEEAELCMQWFPQSYRLFHGYFAVVWCSLAIVLNLLTVVLLQHRTMKSTTNFLLCCTSALQIVLCTLYSLFAIVFYISELRNEPDNLPYEAAVVFYLYVVLSTLANTILMWCTVMVAAFRLLCILFPYRPELYSMQRARIGVALITLASAVCTVPAGLAHSIKATDASAARFTVALVGSVYRDLTFWLNAVLCKLVPSMLLGMLSILLVREMRLVDKKRVQMRGDTAEKHAGVEEHDSRNKRTNRTTRLLATIAILFAVVYFPQSALEIVGAFAQQFNCFYQAVGDVLDELSLINNGVTFILHCAMSQQFRDTLVVVMLAPLKRFLTAGFAQFRTRHIV